jgi:hypothetical protein
VRHHIDMVRHQRLRSDTGIETRLDEARRRAWQVGRGSNTSCGQIATIPERGLLGGEGNQAPGEDSAVARR